MAFTVPTFPLLCNIYTGPWSAKVLRVANVPCNLALGRRQQNNFQLELTPFEFGACCNLLVGAGTDVRDRSCASGYDVIEVVPGSGRWYYVSMVDDVGKGFANEYRFVGLGKVCDAWDPAEFPGEFWPTPIP